MHACKCILQIKLPQSDTHKQEHTLLSANIWVSYIKYLFPHHQYALYNIQ